MPQRIKFDKPLAGFTASSARAGDSVQLVVSGFVSSEDGLDLVDKLEQAVSPSLRKLVPPISPSQVDHFLAIVDTTGEQQVYVNELRAVARARLARKVEPGQPVNADDLVEIGSLDLGVEVPNSSGILFVTSVGWRKAFFFDLGPLGKDTAPRDYDLAQFLGQVHAYLVFQDRCSISEDEWPLLFDKEWFPFIGLPADQVKAMLAHLREGWDLDELTNQIAGVVVGRVESWREAWRDHQAFEEHVELLDRAVDHFLNEDYMSSSAILFPRIEGLIRSFRNISGSKETRKQSGLSRAAVPAEGRQVYSPMLSAKFREYLEKVYFRSFDPDGTEHPANRNTVGHGVAAADSFSKKAATIGLLIVRQLFFSFEF